MNANFLDYENLVFISMMFQLWERRKVRFASDLPSLDSNLSTSTHDQHKKISQCLGDVVVPTMAHPSGVVAEEEALVQQPVAANTPQ